LCWRVFLKMIELCGDCDTIERERMRMRMRTVNPIEEDEGRGAM
jgi:hypothetical protein